MGYQLPGLGNVGFPGFGGLSKQQTSDTARSKKGKDQGRRGIPRSTSTPSSPSSSLSVVPGRLSCDGKFLEKGFLQEWKQELRPLLNSIRFVEASNRQSSNDGISRIGPFQISRQYHQDAWKHSPPMAWSRCKDLDHAENTVIAHWVKCCPEALERRDFEVLAKTHKDGVQGMQKEEASSYWNKVSRYLKKQEKAGTKKENTTWSFFSTEKNTRQCVSSKLHKKASAVLSPINTNTLPSLITPRSSCATPAKQQLPLIQTLRPKLFRRTLPMENKKSSLNCSTSGAKASSAGREDVALNCKKETKKTLQKLDSYRLNNNLKPNSLGHAFNMDFNQLSQQPEGVEKAVTSVQALWRMHCAREKYIRIRNAAIFIQQKWRMCHLLSCHQRIQRMGAKELSCSSSPCLQITTLCSENQGGHVSSGASPCELLYSADISPNQEDELLTELVGLLNLDSESPIESCYSFRFPRSLDETTEVCTPKMKPDSADCRDCSIELLDLSAKRRAEESDCPCLLSVENTPLIIKRALLSPLMEKEIMAELAKLSSPSKGNSQEHKPSAMCSPTDHGSLSKSEDTNVNVLLEHCGKDGIIQRLAFNAPEVEEHRTNSANADIAVNGVLERPGEANTSNYSLPTSLQHIRNKTADEEELNDITIPLLVDQSPVLTSKRRVRCQNPCNRKIEKALVSSLSEWYYAVSSEENCKNHRAFKEKGQVDCRTDASSSFSCTELAASKEFSSLIKSSNAPTKPSKDRRLTEARAEVGIHENSNVLDDCNTGCLLETGDVNNSTVYAKAIFQCLNSMEDYKQGLLLEKSQPSCGAARCRNPGGFPAITSNANLASLQRLCTLWDMLNIDLLTRSSKFKGLQAKHCGCQQGSLSLQGPDVEASLQTEIDCLEGLPKKLEDENRRRDLVLHQRNVIYTNIAAFCNAQERQGLYDKWEVQKLLTGRLKRIVYELLWIDPGRHHESAELVVQYL